MADLISQLYVLTSTDYSAISQIISTSMTICKSWNKINNKECSKWITELNVECLINVVESILHTNIDVKQKMNVDEDYILVDSHKTVLQKLQPKEVMLYYLFESIDKLNTLLIDIKKKEMAYQAQYIKLFRLDCTDEIIQMQSLVKQIHERLQLFNIVK